MNTSYRGSGQASNIINYFKKYSYPHCKSVSNLASLRSGIAIAEVLTQKLPQAYHPLFLPNIEIYNINPQQSILNLKIMLDTLKIYYSHHQQIDICIEDFTPEGLYFDHNMMETFIFTVIMPLSISSTQEIELPFKEKQPINLEMSDIANLSSIIVSNQCKNLLAEKGAEKSKRLPTQKQELIEQEQQRLQKICKWLQEQHHINAEELTPQQIIGQLVNSVFAGSRLDRQKIVKQSHYQLGSATVFKKVGDYLLNCERMPKENVLAMLEQIQTGCMREQMFWNVIQDIMSIRASHLHKIQRKKNTKKSITKTQTNSNDLQNKENLVLVNEQYQNRIEVAKKISIEVYECSKEVLKEAQQWIKNDLGYQYSLNKAQNTSLIQQNPLLNGVLLGSIVMRLQIGKVAINKSPKNKKETSKNMEEVVNCIIRRGLQAGRKFFKYKPTYKAYLGIIWEVKEELQKKINLQKNRRSQQARQRRQQTKMLSKQQKQMVTDWLKQRGYEINELTYIPPSLVSQVCGQILQLRLLRQTTAKIRQSNMLKIINELRRLGWQRQGQYVDVFSEEGNETRWNMLKFAYQLVKFSIYYYM